MGMLNPLLAAFIHVSSEMASAVFTARCGSIGWDLKIFVTFAMKNRI
jgi:hypothetical protein